MTNRKQQAADILATALNADAPEPPKAEKITEETPLEEIKVSEQTSQSEEEEDRDSKEISLNELAEILDCDVVDLYGIQVPMPDNGSPIKIGELKDSERRARKLQSKIYDLEKEREDLKREIESAKQAPATFSGLPMELENLRANAIQWNNFVQNSPEYWKDLRNNDPGEFAAAYTDAQANAKKSADQFQYAFAQWQSYQQQQIKDLLSKKRAKLIERDSRWADDEERKARYRMISEFLRDEGAEVPENLSEVLVDPGWTSALFGAARSAKMAKSVKDETPKKVGSAKLRRGALKSPNAAAKQRLNTLVDKARKTKTRVDKEAAGGAILEQAFSKRE